MGRGLLFLVSGMIILFGIAQKNMDERQTTLASRSADYYTKEQSRNIAGALFEIAVGNLNENHFWNAGLDTILIMGGKGAIEVTTSGFFGSTSTLKITGISGTDTTVIETRLRRTAFSIYSYFTDIEPTIYFTTGDVLNGPVHTNGTFHIDGDPIFNGRVTSPNTPEVESGSDPQYNQGTNFNADYIQMPTDLPDLISQAADGGLTFNNKINVEFKSDGTADITQYECIDSRPWGCAEYQQLGSPGNYILSNYNGIISSSEDVEVKGTLNGKITLHSEKDIEIIGDLRYENENFDDPEAGPVSDDLLGIVSEGDVIVDESAHEDHGTQDVYIDASIMAMGESFYVEDHDQGSYRGNLYVRGGLVQKKRGAVGTLDGGGGIATGYNKNYTYDTRLLDQSTEGFPRQERFSIVYYEETTTY